MEYKFECPHCGQHISATTDLSGAESDCPTCGQRFTVPLFASAKRERTANTRSSFRAVHDFIDWLLTPQTVLTLTVLALLASWVYPPWVHYEAHASKKEHKVPFGLYSGDAHHADYEAYDGARHPHGWFFVFDTEQGEGRNDNLVMRIDVGRLLLIDAIIAVAGGAFAWAVSRNSTYRRMIIRLGSYSLLAASLIAIVCAVVGLMLWLHIPP